MTTYEKSVRTTRDYNIGYYYYKLEVTVNSQSQANNTSNVTGKLYLKGPWSPSFEDYTLSVGIQFIDADGTQSSSGTVAPDIGNSYVLLHTFTKNVKHGANGKLSMPCKCWIYNSNFGSTGYLPLWFSDSNSPMTMGTLGLTDIPREAEFGDVSNFNWEGEISIPITPSPFLDVLRISVGNTVYVERDAYVGSSLRLTAEELLKVYDELNVSETVTLKLTTYQNGNVLGENSITKTATQAGQMVLNNHRYFMYVKDGTAKKGVLIKG